METQKNLFMALCFHFYLSILKRECIKIIGIIKILEIIGTIAFAISGTLAAIKAELDVFGVVFVACITAVGGGVLRDVILGINPPNIFLEKQMCIVAIIVSIIVFVILYIKHRKFDKIRTRIETVNNFFDSVGLATFSIIGSDIALKSECGGSGFVVVIIGMITGVGGGIFRDILTNTTPYVLKKHVYALASILGSLLYFILKRYCENTFLDYLLPMFLTITIRMLATKYRWSLPKIHLDNNGERE